jgi:hypothetical protein
MALAKLFVSVAEAVVPADVKRRRDRLRRLR